MLRRVAACSACPRVCRPRTVGMDAQKCVAQHVADKAARGCHAHRALLGGRPPTRRRNTRQLEAAALQVFEASRPLGHIVLMENPNVYTCQVSPRTLKHVRGVFERLKEDKGRPLLRLGQKGLAFQVVRPAWGKSDIRWISAHDVHTFSFFRSLWRELEVPMLFQVLGEMALFAGYFVARRSVRKSHFHTDFTETGGGAFTLMTPLYDMNHMADCHLLGRDKEGSVKQYRYKLGEAIAFGDSFVHATQTGDAPQTLAFLCFTFGNRRISAGHWESAEQYIQNQCPIYQLPCGRLVESGS